MNSGDSSVIFKKSWSESKQATIAGEETLQPAIRSPESWYRAFPRAMTSGETAGCNPTLVKHFVAIPDEINQPPLSAHVVAIHLGGAKRVNRRQGKRRDIFDVALGSMTVMPAYHANSWQTEGPIEFAHLTISIGAIEQIVVDEYDREPATHQLHDTVGFVDPLLEQVFLAVLQQISRESRSRLYLESLLVVFVTSLLDRHSTLCTSQKGALPSTVWRRGGLAGWQIRRVIDYMHEYIHADVPLGDLAKLTGLSRAHFFRAFRQSTGQTPGQLFANMRMRHAVELLESTELHVDDIANSVGFAHTRHFASAFTKRVGVSPRLFRASRR